mmetsp:Transcript_40231/g.97182  ORF Transcript_40231/g.97182 Transcript_40231/m.97182 type:complete len:89 (+) Transcript_40231:1736-2002(+)
MSFNICCKSSCEILHAHPFRVDHDVKDQPSGKPIEVGSKLTDWDRGTTYGVGWDGVSDDDMIVQFAVVFAEDFEDLFLLLLASTFLAS